MKGREESLKKKECHRVRERAMGRGSGEWYIRKKRWKKNWRTRNLKLRPTSKPTPNHHHHHTQTHIYRYRTNLCCIWFRRDCPINIGGGFAIILIRATRSLARNTVSFSSSYRVKRSSMGSTMQISAGWKVFDSENRKTVMNSWRNILTSTVVSADNGVAHETE